MQENKDKMDRVEQQSVKGKTRSEGKDRIITNKDKFTNT